MSTPHTRLHLRRAGLPAIIALLAMLGATTSALADHDSPGRGGRIGGTWRTPQAPHLGRETCGRDGRCTHRHHQDRAFNRGFNRGYKRAWHRGHDDAFYGSHRGRHGDIQHRPLHSRAAERGFHQGVKVGYDAGFAVGRRERVHQRPRWRSGWNWSWRW